MGQTPSQSIASSARGSSSYSSRSLARSKSSSSIYLLQHHLSHRKGLKNAVGENNCFLNCVIQSLWHLYSFRHLVLSIEHHHTVPEDADKCLFCIVQTIFMQYEYSEERILRPDSLRIALDELSREDGRFQLGQMDDATEAFDAILSFLHHDHLQMHSSRTLSKHDALNTVCDPSCLAHALLQCNLLDLYKCNTCGATSEPEIWMDALYRLYVSEVVLDQTEHQEQASAFASTLYRIANSAPERSCPETARKEEEEKLDERDTCQGKTRVERWLLNFPTVFGISLIWPSHQPTKHELMSILQLITSQKDQQLDLRSIFHCSDASDENDDKSTRDTSIYMFRGMICYYGRHYISFFHSLASDKWFLFDDQNVKVVGTWNDLVEKILLGAYLPTLLLWEKKDVTIKQLESIVQTLSSSAIKPRQPFASTPEQKESNAEAAVEREISTQEEEDRKLAQELARENDEVQALNSPSKSTQEEEDLKLAQEIAQAPDARTSLPSPVQDLVSPRASPQVAAQTQEREDFLLAQKLQAEWASEN